MPGRRTLSFASMDEIMPDVDRLLAGHSTVGNWSLGQICAHLGGAIRGSVEGFPTSAPWVVRKALGMFVLPRLLRSGTMPEGIRVPKSFLPKPGLDARAEAEALRATFALFRQADAPLVPHPFFGKLTGEQWRRIHCIHCAHHLSFVLPGDGGRGAEDGGR